MKRLDYKIAVFRSRSQTVRFFEELKAYRVPSTVVNTPRELAQGCGLSVRFPAQYENKVLQIQSRLQLSSFVGIF